MTQEEFPYVAWAVDLAGVPWEDSYHRRLTEAFARTNDLQDLFGRGRRITGTAMVGDARDGERGWLNPDDECPDCGMEWPDCTGRCPSCGLTIEELCERTAEGSRT